jgi:hypothetical protein
MLGPQPAQQFRAPFLNPTLGAQQPHQQQQGLQVENHLLHNRKKFSPLGQKRLGRPRPYDPLPPNLILPLPKELQGLAQRPIRPNVPNGPDTPGCSQLQSSSGASGCEAAQSAQTSGAVSVPQSLKANVVISGEAKAISGEATSDSDDEMEVEEILRLAAIDKELPENRNRSSNLSIYYKSLAADFQAKSKK